jgi:hypothetical protein
MPAPQGYIISQPYLGLGSIIFGNWRFCGIIIIRSSGYKDKSDSHRVHPIGWLIMHQNSLPKNTCSLRGTSSNLLYMIFIQIQLISEHGVNSMAVGLLINVVTKIILNSNNGWIIHFVHVIMLEIFS